MNYSSKFLLVAFAAMTAAGFAGCGDTTYQIQPDPSSIDGGSAAKDVNEIVPAASNNDETLAKIKELEAKIDEMNQKLAEGQTDETPTTTGETTGETTGGSTGGTTGGTSGGTEDVTPPIVIGPFRKTDIVLTGHSGWSTLPVAFSKGDGTFDVTNQFVGDFATSWSTAPGVSQLTGDFDGDGKTDIALTGPSGWSTLPVAFSKGDGAFKVTNAPAINFAVFSATVGAERLTGDFNGDGKTDIAITGPGPIEAWDIIAVAFSKGDGTFQYTNESVGNFAAWSYTAMFGRLTGDFNGDGKTDIALTGNKDWNTLPVAFSNGDGTFRVTNEKVPDALASPTDNFAVWAATAEKMTGDFNGDGKTDIALTGNKDWSTLPVAFSNGDGTFRVTNIKITNTTEGDFAVLAADPEAARLTGDFDGDGKTDIALAGNKDWSTLPVAFSNGDGTFEVTNKKVGDFADWAAVVEKLTGDFNGDGKTDIALAGGSGWTTLRVAFSNGRDGTFRVTDQPAGDFAGWAVGTARLTGRFK